MRLWMWLLRLSLVASSSVIDNINHAHLHHTETWFQEWWCWFNNHQTAISVWTICRKSLWSCTSWSSHIPIPHHTSTHHHLFTYVDLLSDFIDAAVKAQIHKVSAQREESSRPLPFESPIERYDRIKKELTQFQEELKTVAQVRVIDFADVQPLSWSRYSYWFVWSWMTTLSSFWILISLARQRWCWCQCCKSTLTRTC